MEKKELIKRLKDCESAMDVYNMKSEIIRHLEGGKQREDKPKDVEE